VESGKTEARYLAARCAALADCGLGMDAGRAQPDRAGVLPNYSWFLFSRGLAETGAMALGATGNRPVK